MNEEEPSPDVWGRIRVLVHEKSSSDAEELVRAAEKARRGFIGKMIDFDPSKPYMYDGTKSFGELEAMAAAANDVANASRSDVAWNSFAKNQHEHSSYARKLIRGAVRKDARSQS